MLGVTAVIACIEPLERGVTFAFAPQRLGGKLDDERQAEHLAALEEVFYLPADAHIQTLGIIQEHENPHSAEHFTCLRAVFDKRFIGIANRIRDLDALVL